MNTTILAGGDRRHMTPPPATPPRGRRYLGPDETVLQGDVFWDGNEEIWNKGAASFAGVAARNFVCVCRRESEDSPNLRALKKWTPGTKRRSRAKSKRSAQRTTPTRRRPQ